MEHEDLLASAKALVQDVGSDTSVAREKVRESLEDLKAEIQDMLDAMEDPSDGPADE